MRKILSISIVLIVSNIVTGCVGGDPREAFFIGLKNKVGQNFDAKVKNKTLSANFNKGEGRIVRYSESANTISYAVTWYKSCEYIAVVNKKTRIIESTYIYHDSNECRQQNH